MAFPQHNPLKKKEKKSRGGEGMPFELQMLERTMTRNVRTKDVGGILNLGGARIFEGTFSREGHSNMRQNENQVTE